MKTHDTFPGRSYSVHSTAGCTVSDDSGWSKELAAPEDYFTAHGSKVYLSDDSASMKELFKLAPFAMGGGGGKPGWYDVLRSELAELLGAGNFSLTYAWVEDKFTLTLALPLEITDEQMAQVRVLLGSIPPRNLETVIDTFPSDFTRLEFLESTGTQYIETGYTANNDTTIKVRWLFVEKPSYAGAIFSQKSGGIRFCAIYRDNTFNSRFDYGPNMDHTSGIIYKIGQVYDIVKRGRYNYIDGVLKLTNRDTAPFETSSICISSNESDLHSKYRLYSFIMENNGELKLNLIPALDHTSAPCMFDTVSRTPFYRSGTGQFIAGVETQKQLDAVLRGLPDRTGQDGGELHLRLSDALYESAVASGIIETTATAKNWQIAYDPTTEQAA